MSGSTIQWYCKNTFFEECSMKQKYLTELDISYSSNYLLMQFCIASIVDGSDAITAEARGLVGMGGGTQR